MTSMSEKDYYQLNVSISKALNLLEAPLKLKHARSVIITTHRTKEAQSFWAVISTQPLMENRFTAWKFCHLLHKVLREGHHSAIKQSQCHKSMLIEMGKLWGHLQDGVGNCIQAYCKLLVTKLIFHDKNAFLPGSLSVPFLHIEKFAGDDINVYFQLCVEIFDYLEDIIAVQNNVFRSVDSYRMSSMSPQGQCRLAPLVTLIQDSNPLYDCCVRIMFKLHHNLPNDILSGHRDRFREMFAKLKFFYDKVRPLQYFADLIQVPMLPDSAPNFTSKVDFGNYIPPVVTVPEPEAESERDSDHLVDLASSNERETNDYKETINNYQQTIRAKDAALESIEYHLQSLKSNYKTMEERYQQEILELRNEIGQLQIELKTSNEVRSKIENAKKDLEQQIENSSNLSQRAVELEEKEKLSEEKFSKLKTLYTEMREEHIKLLRQNAETRKHFNQQMQFNEELKTEKMLLLKELKDSQEKFELDISEKKKIECILEEKQGLINELQKECIELRSKEKNYKQSENFISLEIANKNNELKVNIEKLEMTKAMATEMEEKLLETEVKLNRKISEHEETISQLNNQLKSNTTYMDELKQVQLIELKNLTTERDDALKKLADLSNTLRQKEIDFEKLLEKMSLTEKDLYEMVQNNEKLKTKCADAIAAIELAESKRSECKIKSKNAIASFLDNIFRTARSIISLNFNESGQQRFERSFQITEEIQRLLKDFKQLYYKYITTTAMTTQADNDDNCSSHDELVSNIIFLCYQMCMLREQCMLVYNTTTDIDKGQQIFDMLLSMAEPIELLFTGVQTGEMCEVMNNRTLMLQSEIEKLESILRGLTKQLDSNAELGDIIESELFEMEKAIAEAAEKFVELLSQTRSNDDGIKLEVNEKILDACTNLMDCIKRLIKQSKILQDEIVSSGGRGKISAKEFYKRNSEWTEGLISASKSVAKGANFLVEAANKAVLSDSGKNFEIIVAAQEIAACTAQLVISSKVKAPKGSNNLQDLTKASRMVSQATGAVVAIVKDSNHRLENYTDIDLSKLTTSQAKTMEMDIHVKVLELEQALQLERLKLCAFRRNLYQNSEN